MFYGMFQEEYNYRRVFCGVQFVQSRELLMETTTLLTLPALQPYSLFHLSHSLLCVFCSQCFDAQFPK